MDKRTIAKMFVKTLVIYLSGATIEKTLVATVPATKKFKTAELAGAMGGWYIGESLEPETDKLVDNIFDKYQAPKPLTK